MVAMFARRGIKNVNAISTKSNNHRAFLIVALIVFLFTLFLNQADAKRIKDIKQRTKQSVFIPRQSAQEIAKPMRDRIFSSPLETVIVKGPANNSSIQNTHVEFSLDGWQIVPFEKVGRFDIWLVGFDAGWHEASNNIYYDLPPGRKTYTFMARAKNNDGEYDATPVVLNFGVFVSSSFGQVDIGNVNAQGSFKEPQKEKITLYARDIDNPVDVTGWRVVVKRGSFSFVIPSVARILDPRSVWTGDRIVLNRGDSLDIFVGKNSPVGGVGFQENACLGYLSDRFEGDDAISNTGNCQLPSSSLYSHFNTACREFLRGIGYCHMPEMGYNQPARWGYLESLGSECQNFIAKNYNYDACVERSKNQAGFYSGRWRIYLGRNDGILDDLDDEIYLYDSQGLLVARYSY